MSWFKLKHRECAALSSRSVNAHCVASSCRSVNAQLQAVTRWMRSFKLSQGECAGYCCPADVGSGKRTQSFRLNENSSWNDGAVYSTFPSSYCDILHSSSPLIWLPGNDVGRKILCIIQKKSTVLESFGVLSCHCYLPEVTTNVQRKGWDKGSPSPPKKKNTSNSQT